MVVCNSNPPVDAGGGTMMGVEKRLYLGQEYVPLYEKSEAFTVDIWWILIRLPLSRQTVLHHLIPTNHAISLHRWQAGPLPLSWQLGIVVEFVEGSKAVPAPFPNQDAWYPWTFRWIKPISVQLDKSLMTVQVTETIYPLRTALRGSCKDEEVW